MYIGEQAKPWGNEPGGGIVAVVVNNEQTDAGYHLDPVDTGLEVEVPHNILEPLEGGGIHRSLVAAPVVAEGTLVGALHSNHLLPYCSCR